MISVGWPIVFFFFEYVSCFLLSLPYKITGVLGDVMPFFAVHLFLERGFFGTHADSNTGLC